MNTDTEAMTLLKQMSLPKLILISAILGGVLGALDGFLPESICWNEGKSCLPHVSWAIKTVLGISVFGVTIKKFDNGTFEWLKKPGNESS